VFTRDAYQTPINFHHAKPAVLQITMFTTLTMAPILHQVLSVT